MRLALILLCIASTAHAQEASKRFRRGIADYEAGRYERASIELHEVVQAETGDASPIRQRGD